MLVVGAALAATLVVCAVSVATPPTKALFERTYRVVSVTVRSGGDPFEGDPRVRVSFGRESVTWSARCNIFGGEMKIRPHRLWVKPNFQTEQGCSSRAERENVWLLAFFGADPRWEAGRRGTLVLTAGSGTLTLAPSVTTM